jgi:hypothetical protein
VAVKAGERELLPKVRGLGNDVILIADGFSCREQIEQGTGHHAMHIAQLAQRALAAR